MTHPDDPFPDLCTLGLTPTSADTYAPLTPLPGEERRTPKGVLGHLRTTSFAGAELSAGRHTAFEDEARALPDDLAASGPLLEEAVFTVPLARRPGGAR